MAVLETVKSVYSAESIQFHEGTDGDGHPGLKSVVEVNGYDVEVFVLTTTSDEWITLLASTPVKIPSDRLADVATLIAGLNFHMNLGRFDLDLDTGSVRYLVFLPLTDATLSAAQFGSMYNTAMTSLLQHLDTIEGVGLEEVDGKMAFEAVRQGLV